MGYLPSASQMNVFTLCVPACACLRDCWLLRVRGTNNGQKLVRDIQTRQLIGKGLTNELLQRRTARAEHNHLFFGSVVLNMIARHWLNLS